MTTLLPPTVAGLRRRGRAPRLPGAVPRRQRAAAGLPRQRVELAQAGAGRRRRARVRPAALQQRAPRRAHAEPGGHRRLRGGPQHHRLVHRRAARRGRLHQERHRGLQPRRVLVRQRQGGRALPPRPRRRGRRHRDGAPLQPRAVADALRAHRRHAEVVRPDRRRPARPRHRPDHRAHQGGRLRPPEQHPRDRQPGRRDRPPRQGRRRPDAARRRPVRAAHAGRRDGARRRLPGRSPGTSCWARPASASCGGARSCSTPCPRSSAAAR